VVVSLRDSASKGHATVWGDLWCLVSALFYAVYTVTLARRVKDDRKVNMQLVFGFIGLFNAATLWPLFFVLRAVGLEPSQAPTWKDMAALTLNGLFGRCVGQGGGGGRGETERKSPRPRPAC
jgi:drug/metabolite transporter (DMT)-like permease